jgi:hypothetical protein
MITVNVYDKADLGETKFIRAFAWEWAGAGEVDVIRDGRYAQVRVARQPGQGEENINLVVTGALLAKAFEGVNWGKR